MTGSNTAISADELRAAVGSWNFHKHLDRLETAYNAACARPMEMVAEAQRRAKQLTADWAQYDDMDFDERESLTDYADGLDDGMSDGITSLSLVREAFIISLFHFWEKQIRDLGGAAVCDKEGRYHHDRAMGHCKTLGFRVVAKELAILKYAAEVAKYSFGPSAKKLLTQRPGCFVNGTRRKTSIMIG